MAREAIKASGVPAPAPDVALGVAFRTLAQARRTLTLEVLAWRISWAKNVVKAS